MEAHSTERSDQSVLFPLAIARRGAERASGYWWLYVLLGVVSIALGAITLSTTVNAVSTLVVIFSLFLLYAGVSELFFGATSSRSSSWLALVAGLASIAAGIIALAWPGITLFVLAMFVGWGLMVWGIYDIYLALADPVVRPRWVMLVRGIVVTAIGVLALARPNATIVVLAVVVGIFFIAYGVFAFVGGLRLLDVHQELKRSKTGKVVAEEMKPAKAA